MKRHLTLIAVLVIAFSTTSGAKDRLVVKQSPHTVAATIDRLSDALKRRGIPIVARVDHASAAERAGEKLGPTQLLIFGNPKLGTPLMQSNRRIGLDLPMKVLAWRDEAGQTWLAYVRPDILKSDHAISDRDSTFKAMEQALEALTGEAVRSD